MQNVAVINTCISGSTGKIASGLNRYLNSIGMNSFFCYGREDGKVENNYYRIGTKTEFIIHVFLTRLCGLQGFGSYFATKKLIRFLIKNSIDTVFTVNLHGYYLNEKLFLEYLGKNNINTIYIMADEYAFLGKCPYNNNCEKFKYGCKRCPQRREYPKSWLFSGAPKILKMKRIAYLDLQRIVFVGPEYVVNKAKESPITAGKHFEIVDEAIDTTFYSPKDTKDLNNKLGIDQEKIVLVCVAKLSVKQKGCQFFIELAKRFENNDNYIFVHVGYDKEIKYGNLPRNYIPINYVNNQEELVQYYSIADLLVFPSLQDTMPNTCLEAMSTGTPLLCFDIQGMPYIGDDTVAKFVEAKNVNQMEQYVKTIKKKDDITIKICRDYALGRYDNKKYYKKLVNIAKGNL